MKKVTVKAAPRRCPCCNETVEPTQAQSVCETCLAAHHRECWSDHSGCSSHGCDSKNALIRAKADSPATTPEAEQRSEPAPFIDLDMSLVEIAVWVAVILIFLSLIFVNLA